MGYNTLKLTQQDKTLIITLNRPGKLNALNLETMEELKDVMQEQYDDPDTSGIIITGEGEKAFAAGADIAEISVLNELNARKFAERGQEVFFLIENCPKPILAAVNGYALGGGCELAMACHMRIAVATAKFGQPEVSLGIIPGYGGTQRLTQLVGKGRAMELILTGDTIGATEGDRIGLVNHVVATHAELLPTCHQILNKIYTKGPYAVGLAIDCVNAVFTADDGFQTEANNFANCCKTEDFKEGTEAFLEKRTPVFVGR